MCRDRPGGFSGLEARRSGRLLVLHHVAADEHLLLHFFHPLREAGGRLESVTVAYETWGTLADDGGNGALAASPISVLP